jgi:hypothetical protein
MNAHSTLSTELQSCIDICVRSHEVCLRMATAECAQLEPRHFTLMLDCALICQMAADFMLRSSPRHRDLCALCAEMCLACADDCARIGDMDECVQACS